MDTGPKCWIAEEWECSHLELLSRNMQFQSLFLSRMTAVQDTEVLFRSFSRFSESSCNIISQHRELTGIVYQVL